MIRTASPHTRNPLTRPALWSLAFLVAFVAALLPASARAAEPEGVAAAPIQTIKTADGTVGYRVVGEGPPLVLLPGHGGTIDDWDPALIDRLAARHRVYLPDNAGVGRTTIPKGGVTIPAMSNQVAAFIAATGLRGPTVLGWSEGGMVAQDLAVAHPGRVGRLILAATFPGDGKAVPIPKSTVEATAKGADVLELLFPSDQRAAARAYASRLGAYPGRELVKPSLERRQGFAAALWYYGKVPAGHRISSIRQPTLVAAGADDVYAVPANSRRLAAAIPGAELALYPDAGHAFLFQDAAAFTARIEAFLGA